jgi:IS5 family transposase
MIKHQFGFQKTRYRGIKKNDHKLKMLFALANLYKIRQRRPATA